VACTLSGLFLQQMLLRIKLDVVSSDKASSSFCSSASVGGGGGGDGGATPAREEERGEGDRRDIGFGFGIWRRFDLIRRPTDRGRMMTSDGKEIDSN